MMKYVHNMKIFEKEQTIVDSRFNNLGVFEYNSHKYIIRNIFNENEHVLLSLILPTNSIITNVIEYQHIKTHRFCNYTNCKIHTKTVFEQQFCFERIIYKNVNVCVTNIINENSKFFNKWAYKLRRTKRLVRKLLSNNTKDTHYHQQCPCQNCFVLHKYNLSEHEVKIKHPLLI